MALRFVHEKNCKGLVCTNGVEIKFAKFDYCPQRTRQRSKRCYLSLTQEAMSSGP